jgi:hypothetical protein
MFQTRPETQTQIEALTVALCALPVGETASYDALNKAAPGHTYWSLLAARKATEEQTGMRLACVRSEGIKKLAAKDIASIGATARVHIRRVAKVQGKRLAGLSYNDMDAAQRRKVDVERSLLGAVAMVTSTKSANAMARDEQPAEHPAARVLSMLAGATS